MAKIPSTIENEDRVSTLEVPKKTQTKFLTANVTTDTTLTDLTFNNLVVGQWYDVYLHMNSTIGATADNFGINISHDGSTIGSLEHGDASGSTVSNGSSILVQFVATATTVTFVTVGMGAASTVRGNGTVFWTHARLSETFERTITTDWT